MQGASRGQQGGVPPLPRRALPALALTRRCLVARWAVPWTRKNRLKGWGNSPEQGLSGNSPEERLLNLLELAGACRYQRSPSDCPPHRTRWASWQVVVGGDALRGVAWQQTAGSVATIGILRMPSTVLVRLSVLRLLCPSHPLVSRPLAAGLHSHDLDTLRQRGHPQRPWPFDMPGAPVFLAPRSLHC